MHIAAVLVLVGGCLEIFGVLMVASPSVRRRWASVRLLIASDLKRIRVLIYQGIEWFRQRLPRAWRRPRVIEISARFGATLSGRAQVEVLYGWHPTQSTEDQLAEIRRNVDSLHAEVRDLPESLETGW